MSVLCCIESCTALAEPGLERCRAHELRRHRAREYARRRRERTYEAALRTAFRCPKRFCGGPVVTRTGDYGQTVVVCEWCERAAAGICRDCSRPVYGAHLKSLRCREHAELAKREQLRAYTRRHHDEVLARARASYHQPERRAHRNEYKRLWRKANRDKVREQKRRYVERHRDDERSAYRRYHAKYRKRHAAYYRELQNARNAREREGWTPPPCTRCGRPTGWTPVPGRTGGRPWTKCMRCCSPCERKERRRIRRAAAKRIAADPRFGLPPKPVTVRKPRAPAVRGPGLERLCVTPGCDVVVSHRKKKCTKCRERDRQLAAERLAAHHGRGRRVDLEGAA